MEQQPMRILVHCATNIMMSSSGESRSMCIVRALRQEEGAALFD